MAAFPVVCIFGSRAFTGAAWFCALDWLYTLSGLTATQIVSGGAAGADNLGELLAKQRGIPTRIFRADWSKGLHMGHVRNGEMAAYSDCGLGIWDGRSSGTADMMRKLQLYGKPFLVLTTRDYSLIPFDPHGRMNWKGIQWDHPR